MNRTLRSLTAAAALVFASQAAFVAPSAQAAPAPVQVLPSVLNQMEQAARSLKTLQAALSQEVVNTELGGTDRLQGTFAYKAGAPGSERMILQYTKPSPQTISVIGNQVVVYQPEIQQALFTTRQAQASKHKSIGFLGLGYGQAASQLREKYTVTYVGPDKEVGNATLLTFDAKVVENGVKGMFVWVDSKTWLPVKYVIDENGSQTTIMLSSMKRDETIPDSKFEISLPGNVRKVQG